MRCRRSDHERLSLRVATLPVLHRLVLTTRASGSFSRHVCHKQNKQWNWSWGSKVSPNVQHLNRKYWHFFLKRTLCGNAGAAYSLLAEMTASLPAPTTALAHLPPPLTLWELNTKQYSYSKNYSYGIPCYIETVRLLAPQLYSKSGHLLYHRVAHFKGPQTHAVHRIPHYRCF